MVQGRFGGVARVSLALFAAAVVASGCGDKKKVTAPEAALRDDAPLSDTGPLAGATVPPFVTPEAVQVPATPQFPRPSEGAHLAKLVIPKAKVNHRLTVKGLNARREMEDPGSKDDVAWYNFSTLPGFGSNAVLSGHVDWYTGDRGVFWYLRDLQEGDEAEVHYSDGMVLRYRVSRVEVYAAETAPVAEITGPTTKDVLTMITCDGVFVKAAQEYTQRRVVFAERVG